MRDKLEHWQKLNNKYLNGIEENPEKYFKINSQLVKRYATSSWYIEEFITEILNETISQSKFRELVRWTMNENFNKIIKDKINVVNSLLAQEKHVKLTKTINVDKVAKLEAQVEILKSLII